MVLRTLVSRGGLLARYHSSSAAAGKDTGESGELAGSQAGTGDMSLGVTVPRGEVIGDPRGVQMSILDGKSKQGGVLLGGRHSYYQALTVIFLLRVTPGARCD